MIKEKIRLFLTAFMMMLFVVTGNAQVTTSGLSGRVSDANGSVAGVAVVAVYQPSNTTYYAVTNGDGVYSITNMRPGGPYSLTYELLGYQTVVFENVVLSLAENATLDVELTEAPESLEGSVIVADAKGRSLNTGSSTYIPQRTIENMPTSTSRSLNDILKLTPQASVSGSGLAVGGGNYRGSYVTVDGAAFNNAFGIGQNLPAGGSPISIDAIEQMSINITPFDVRQSGFQGGAINAVTKSGTNEFHASAYNYYTSEKVRGNLVSGNEVTNNKSLNNTVGVTVGGPIIKDKLFFFVNGEYSFDNVPGSSKVARTSESDAWGSGTQFNRPTVSQLENIKSFLSDKFNGYNPGRYQDYSLKTPDYKVMARLDWNINRNNTLTTRFSYTHNYGSNQPSSSMSPIGGTNSSFKDINGAPIYFNRYSAGRQSDYTMYFESARYFQEQNFMSIASELNSRFENGNNMLRVAWSHQFEPRSYVGDFFPTVDILSKDGVTGSDTHAMITTFGVDPFTYGNLRDVQTIVATDEVTYTAGINNFTFGAQYEFDKVINGFMQGGAGWFIYDSWDNFVADVNNPSSTTGPVAFMITHANLDDPTQQTFPAFTYHQGSVYVQDELNIARNFKLTAGARVEVPIYNIPTDNENKDFSRLAQTSGSSFYGLNTADVPAIRATVSPRLGFNWDVFDDNSFIIRGGSGLFVGRIPNVWLVSAIGNDNCLQMQYINKNVVGNGTNEAGIHFNTDRAKVISALYPNGFKKQDLTAPTAGTIIAKDLKMPSSWKSSLSFDINLPNKWSITIDGLYSVNYNEVYATMLGHKQEGTITLPGEPGPRNKWVAENIKNSNGQTVNGYYIHNESGIHGSYASVSAKVAKEFDFGLALSAAYAYSTAQSVSDGNGDQISEFANTYGLNGCNEPILGYANYVAPHRAIFNGSYTIKEGKNLATKLGVFYEGYNIGFYSNYSYSRVSYLMNNVSGAGSASQLIYIPTDAELDGMPFSSEANKADYRAFLAADKYTSKHRGEYAKRNGVLAPWLNRINARVAQDIKFNIAGRTQTLEIGVDANNVGNLINSAWGIYKQLNTNNIINYKNGQYTFTAPVWNDYANVASTWSLLLSARYYF